MVAYRCVCRGDTSTSAAHLLKVGSCAGVKQHDAKMAVLVMEMIRSDLSFVLHTVDPLDRDQTLLSAEMAVGLGETLASGTRGSPWRFAIGKADSAHSDTVPAPGLKTRCA